MTLVETMASLSIGAIVVGGSIKLAYDANYESNMKAFQSGVMDTGKNVEQLFSRSVFVAGSDMTKKLIAVNEYSPKLKSDSNYILSPFGNKISVIGYSYTANGGGTGFKMVIMGLDIGKCIGIVSYAKGSVFSGYQVGTVKEKLSSSTLSSIDTNCSAIGNSNVVLYSRDLP